MYSLVNTEGSLHQRTCNTSLKHTFVHDFIFFPVKQSRIIFLFRSNLFVQPRLDSFMKKKIQMKRLIHNVK